METRKIAVACFVGGVLCCGVALLFAPFYWWLGLIAGFSGGYISYEFREVRRSIPIALHATRRGSVYAWDDAIAKAKAWFYKSHPFFYSAAVVATPIYVWGLYYIGSSLLIDPIMDAPVISIVLVALAVFYMIGLVAAFLELTWAIMVLLLIFAFIGSRIGERCYWWPFLMATNTLEEDVRKLEEKGLRQKPLSYGNVARWFAKGLGLTILFFTWTLWKHIILDVWAAICFFCRFFWYLFKLIHSEKRVLCAIDGTLGGAASYIWLASASMSLPQQAVLVIFGGLLGAAFGVVNWEIVSKRILQVVPANSTSA